jgi:hypothetical protein
MVAATLLWILVLDLDAALWILAGDVPATLLAGDEAPKVGIRIPYRACTICNGGKLVISLSDCAMV